jgi:hypothetical protein
VEVLLSEEQTYSVKPSKKSLNTRIKKGSVVSMGRRKKVSS